jgi:hypothetical protein
MIHAISIWLLVAAFSGAGLFNAIGTRSTREGFVRWGCPSWWHWVTGVEIMSASAASGLLRDAFGPASQAAGRETW